MKTKPVSKTPSGIQFVIILFFSFLINGCSKNDGPSSGSNTPTTIDSTTIVSGTAEGSTETGYDADDLVESSTFSSTVSISFGSSVAITNPLSSGGVKITQNGSDIIITSSASEVEYLLSGTTADGSVKIYSDKKFKLTLNGVTITNSDGPAINIQSSKKAFIVLADNTTNMLSDGATYAASTNGEDMKGTFFSEGQLVFSGNGVLSVKGNYKHAIVSDDYIRVRSGTITITGSVTDGIHSNDSFIADGGTFNITAGSDGIECEKGYIIINNGTFTINTVDKGITASYDESDATITPYVTINGGTISIKSSVGEGIQSKSVLTINNGNISTITADDGLNAGTAIYINGGYIYSNSTANDAMDSNGIVTITGGKIIAIGATLPASSINCGTRALKITGGIVVGAAGASSSASATVSTVPSVIMGGGTANQLIHIESMAGTEALTFLIPTTCTTMLYGSSKLKMDSTYKVYTGGSVAAGTTFNGLYTSGTYTKGTNSTSFTTSSLFTQIGGTVTKE